LTVLIAWTLAAARPAHVRMAPWAGAVLIAAVVGYAGQAGLSRAQSAFEDWVSDWILHGMAADPYRSSTDLGSVGRLKMIDAIVMRVYPEPAQASPPGLLHRASFTSFEGATWTARRSPMSALAPEADGVSWKLAAGRPRQRTRIFIRLEGGKALLALPAGTLQLAAMAAATVRRNALGAVQAEFGGEWAPYTAESTAAPDDEYAAPTADDVQIARGEQPTIQEVAAQLQLQQLSSRQALDRVRQHFAGFQYATYRASPVAPGSTAIADFLVRSKSGHCEYFAAATTLLLRAAGIPARYATGFAVTEYSTLEQAYVVRARHAHAWTRAYVDGHWIDVDTTPPSWTEEEARAAPAWQKVADFLRWAQFRWSQAGPIELGLGWASVLVAALAFFGWRLLRGKRAKAAAEPASRRQRRFAGSDSEFYAIEAKLAARVGRRAPHESIAAWRRRIEPALDATLREALDTIQALHYRHRFDPRGLDSGERRALREHCLALDARLESSHG
ncbi:MAG TPA: transglutaminase-like domain-containing protein, partial [Burkholderiales bacterium]